MKYDTLLFDFDGTLTPSLELWLQAFQYALAQYQRELPDRTIIDRFFYTEYTEVAQEFGLPPGPDFERHVRTGLTHAFSDMRLFPGVRDVLDYGAVKGIPMGLVTSAPKPQVQKALKDLDIAYYFDAVVTGDDITHFKPHPEPVLMALEALRKPAQGTLFIGDYTVDVIAGRAAGTETALFLPEQHGRFYDFATLHATRPGFVFSAYPELLEHLQFHPEMVTAV
jgi:pyrophosphatase PpaX